MTYIVTYAALNGHMTDDVTGPHDLQNVPVFKMLLLLEFCSDLDHLLT